MKYFRDLEITNTKMFDEQLFDKRKWHENAPQIGNTPMVIPNAAENASCFGSAPLKGTQIKNWFHFLHNTEYDETSNL